MLNIQKKEINRLTTLLKSAGASYDILLPDGVRLQHGSVSKTADTNAPSGHRYRRGETPAYFLPLIKDLKPGEAVEIPFDRFHPYTLASNIGSHAFAMWGKGNYTSSRDNERKVVELLRMQ